MTATNMWSDFAGFRCGSPPPPPPYTTDHSSFHDLPIRNFLASSLATHILRYLILVSCNLVWL